MSTHFALPEPDSFPPCEPWKLGGRSEAVSLAQLTDAARIPSPEVLRDLASRGLNPRSRNTFDDCAIKDASLLISQIPSLEFVVRAHIRGLAVVRSKGPEYDTSHSEPAWPGWAFVSLPPVSPIGSARLAESLVHEAMHMNLSDFEETAPLIIPAADLYSPWKHEMRTVQGVLHGLYVFGCLYVFFRTIVVNISNTDVEKHLYNRMRDIIKEVITIDRFALEAALTPSGLGICQTLYSILEHDIR